MNTTPTPQPLEVYATFAGNIDQAACQRIFQAIANGTANKVTHIHLLFQSTGGFVADGVCLYNFFQSLPIVLTIYNVGSVQSIAAIAFLGAQQRVVSETATFMFHRTANPALTGTAASYQAAANMLAVDDKRTEAILRKHLRLSDQQWVDLDKYALVLSGQEAVNVGIANKLGTFAPPKGAQIYNI